MTQYNRDTYCSFAFTGYDNRNKWVCCISTGNLNNHNEANASEEVQNLRKDLLNGVKNPLCQQCWDLESVGLKSTRQNSLENLSHNEIIKEIQSPKLKFLWFNSGNNCNFSCRTCDPLWSSGLYKEQIDRKGSSHVTLTKANVAALMDTDLSEIKRIVILGGEPFLNLDFVELLEKIADQGYSQQCGLVYITNNSKRLPDKIKNITDKFASSMINLSIDATENQFEYIRTRGKWNSFVENLNYLKSLQQEIRGINIAFHVTVSALNVMYLEKLWEWLNENKHNQGYTYNISTAFCLNPEHYSFSVFTPNEKDKIKEKLVNSKFDFSGIIRQLENTDFDPIARKKFFEELAWTKQYHKLDYEQCLPLLANILEN